MTEKTNGLIPCDRCQGCGKIANSDDGEAWTYWLNMPLKNAGAVLAGLVKPLPCPVCGGSGKMAAFALIDIGIIKNRIADLQREIRNINSYSGPICSTERQDQEIKVLEWVLKQTKKEAPKQAGDGN